MISAHVLMRSICRVQGVGLISETGGRKITNDAKGSRLASKRRRRFHSSGMRLEVMMSVHLLTTNTMEWLSGNERKSTKSAECVQSLKTKGVRLCLAGTSGEALTYRRVPPDCRFFAFGDECCRYILCSTVLAVIFVISYR